MKYLICVFAPYTGKRTYTYLADAVPGDYLVVKTPSNGYQVVRVVGIDKAPQTNITYKEAIQNIGQLDERTIQDSDEARTRL